MMTPEEIEQYHKALTCLRARQLYALKCDNLILRAQLALKQFRIYCDQPILNRETIYILKGEE